MNRIFPLLVLSIIFIDAVSAGPSACVSYSKRRHADAAAEFNPADFEGTWNGDTTISSLDGCADEDTFVVTVVVVDHLWLKFEPTAAAGPTCNQTYIFDSQILTTTSGLVYSVGILQPLNKSLPSASSFSSGYVTGTITTLDLIDAIETFDGEFGGEYDIVTSNCAAKIIDVLTYLNFTVNNATFLDWIATQLQTPKVVGLLKNSTNIDVLYPGMARADILAKPDAELISTLTYWSANETLAMYGESLNFYRAQAAAPKAAPKAAPPKAAAPSVVAAPTSAGTKQPVSNAPQGSGKASPATSFVASIALVGLSAAISALL
eukprot:TRINITY_DN2000_c0_g1_i2.p2 TRINITY_DN2000_c0_g1~~TRINITY_DN2000_c0_g1_i2.p2  ORF type:complete len:320 (+),score=72.67 TRINITY_DN2000_c0_g1_i2:90-1049(+)